MRYNLAACMIFRDEASNLAEWVEYHHMLGIEHFYLYSHRSEDNFNEVLSPYVDAGLVTLEEWNFPRASTVSPADSRGPTPQVIAYDYTISTYKDEASWIAFIDCDEFIAQMSDESITSMLTRCDGAAGVLLNWCTFGSSGYDVTPEGLTIENYCNRATKTYGLNHHVKSIVCPTKVWKAQDPHQFILAHPSDYYVNTHGLVLGPFGGANIQYAKTDHVLWSHFRVNHYAVKSRQHVVWKLKTRGRMTAGNVEDSKKIDDYFNHHDKNGVRDVRMLQHVPELRRRLHARELAEPSHSSKGD